MIADPWSSLVGGDEQRDRPNSHSMMPWAACAVHIGVFVINTTVHDTWVDTAFISFY